MRTQYYALGFGVVYILIGILSFLPVTTTPPPQGAPALWMDVDYAYLFGVFPVNALHNMACLTVGIWGVMANGRFVTARGFSRVMAVLFAVLALLGLIPGSDIFFGAVPLFGSDVWLHSLTALLSFYFGWFVPAETVYSTRPRTR